MSESTENPISTIEYKPPVKRAFFILISLSLFSLLIIYRLRVDEIGGQDWWKALLTFALASSVPITILIKSLFVFRPKIFCKFEVYEDRLLKRWGKHVTEFRYEDLDQVKFSRFSPRFFGGFTILHRNGMKLHFPSLVENCSDLVESISKKRPDLFNENSLQSFLNLNRALDHSWSRIREKAMNWKMWLPKYLVLQLILAGVFAQKSLDYFTWFFIVVAYTYLIAFLLNLLDERVWLAKMAGGDSSGGTMERDRDFEKNLTIGIETMYYIISLLLTILIYRVF